VRFDLITLALLVPLSLWMGVLDARVLAAAALAIVGSMAMKHLARTSNDIARGHVLGFAAYVLNVVSVLVVSRSFGPLFFTPVLLTFFTLAYTMSPAARYRGAIMGTGAAALVGSILVEAFGLLPRSYVFAGGDALTMTIVAHAVRLREVPTMTALSVGALLMIVGPAIMMARQHEAVRAAEQKSALQAWHLKHLLPDEAQAPVSRATPSRASAEA
jgi:eukaryotic-like serine/threonine-protein kinase